MGASLPLLNEHQKSHYRTGGLLLQPRVPKSTAAPGRGDAPSPGTTGPNGGTVCSTRGPHSVSSHPPGPSHPDTAGSCRGLRSWLRSGLDGELGAFPTQDNLSSSFPFCGRKDKISMCSSRHSCSPLASLAGGPWPDIPVPWLCSPPGRTGRSCPCSILALGSGSSLGFCSSRGAEVGTVGLRLRAWQRVIWLPKSFKTTLQDGRAILLPLPCGGLTTTSLHPAFLKCDQRTQLGPPWGCSGDARGKRKGPAHGRAEELP